MVDFIVIGAMKCATSTLHEQLAAQPAIFMSDPKEPCFFSDDGVWRNGLGWYESLFDQAGPGELWGESSTHYTKLPTYPHTVERMAKHVPNAKLIYMMRHPLDRLVSQYIHQWTELEIACDLNQAVDQYPELTSYSQYAMQLQPFLESYGKENILPVFLGQMKQRPQQTLNKVCDFIGYTGTPQWQEADAEQNESAQRMRTSRLRDFLTYAPGISQVRQYLVPQAVRDRIKKNWQMTERPELSAENVARLTEIFDSDLARLGELLGVRLTCENFKTVTGGEWLSWR